MAMALSEMVICSGVPKGLLISSSCETLRFGNYRNSTAPSPIPSIEALILSNEDTSHSSVSRSLGQSTTAKDASESSSEDEASGVTLHLGAGPTPPVLLSATDESSSFPQLLTAMCPFLPDGSLAPIRERVEIFGGWNDIRENESAQRADFPDLFFDFPIRTASWNFQNPDTARTFQCPVLGCGKYYAYAHFSGHLSDLAFGFVPSPMG